MSLPPSRLLTLAPWKLGCFGHAVMPRAAGGLQILERRWETTELHEKGESITLGTDNDYNTWGKFPCHTALYSYSFKCCSTLGMRAKGTGHWTWTLHGVLEFISYDGLTHIKSGSFARELSLQFTKNLMTTTRRY